MAKRKNKKTARKIIFFLLIVLILGGGIWFYLSKKGGNNSILPIIKKEEPVKKKVQIIDEDSKTRNIAVMINNISTVWGYQAGLQDAYIVYEIIVEGSITRLMAIYKDVAPEKIGTVRSARAYYLDYVLENDAIYLHIGGSPGALDDINKLKINDLVEGTATYRVKNGLSYEHTAFSSMEKIQKAIEKKKYRTTTEQKNLLKYDADSIDLSKMEGAIPANEITIDYGPRNESKRSFTYDAEKKVYNRFQGGKKHIDSVTKEQYTAKNIIAYGVKNGTISGDDKGRQELDNIGSGEGYYVSEGYAVPITWEKKSRSSQTVYKYKNGQELVVNDGNTYIEIYPKNEEFAIK